MKIKKLTVESLRIPFKVKFRHNSATRIETQSVLVQTETDEGSVGYGEGCPREYVTGESLESCHSFFNEIHDDLIATINSPGDLVEWEDVNREYIDKNPAAWCGIELSLLDALSKDMHQSVERTLGSPELVGRFRYTAIIGDSSMAETESQANTYAKYGFSDFKLKISGDPAIDSRKMEIISSFIPGAKIRLDANNLWKRFPEVVDYFNQITQVPVAIEEPLQAMNYAELEALVKVIGVPVIVDESFYLMSHFDQIRNLTGKVFINLRVSKMGGIIRSRKIAKEAATRGIPLIVGAQVGETSLLTRAALTIANEFRQHVYAQEGAYGTLLLESDLTERPLMFGKYGDLEVESQIEKDKFGLQLSIREMKPFVNDLTFPASP